MFYTLGCFHKGLSSTLSYYCYDVAILALKAFAVKLNGIQKQRTWSSQRGIQSEKFIYFFLHRKCTLHTVRIWEMTLKGFYQEGALQLYPSTESKHGSQRWVLEELWAWVLGGGVIISLPPTPYHSTVCRVSTTAVTHSEQAPAMTLERGESPLRSRGVCSVSRCQNGRANVKKFKKWEKEITASDFAMCHNMIKQSAGVLLHSVVFCATLVSTCQRWSWIFRFSRILSFLTCTEVLVSRPPLFKYLHPLRSYIRRWKTRKGTFQFLFSVIKQ